MSFYSTCRGGCNRGHCNGAFNPCPCANPFCSGFGTTPIIPSTPTTPTTPITNVLLKSANFGNTANGTSVASLGLLPMPTTLQNNSVGLITNNTTTFTLSGDGIYNVNYCLTITNPENSTQTISVALTENGNTLNETIQTFSVASNATIGLCSVAQVKVSNNTSVVIGIKNLSTIAVDLKYGNITITKIA